MACKAGDKVSNSQVVTVSSSIATVAIPFTIQTDIGTPWLKVNPTASMSPDTLNITADCSQLAGNAYSGAFTVLPGGSLAGTAVLVNLTVASADNKPTLNSGTVASAGAFNRNAGIASGTWIEIFGSNLATETAEWSGSDFQGNTAPTLLKGTSVTINGKAAFVRYVSPGQINVQLPDDPATGPVQLIVTNANGSSNPVTVQKSVSAPALLAPPPFNIAGKQYVVALFPDNTYVGRPGLITGLATRLAKPSDTIIMYGIGFGPVTPGVPAGTIAPPVSSSLQSKPVFFFGQTEANVTYYGLAPGFVGLYQFNVVVPNVSSGDVRLTVISGGVTAVQDLYIAIQ